MDAQDKTIIALVLGLLLGIGLGWVLAPDVVITQPQTPTDLSKIGDKINSLTTLIYASIGAALVSAIASIVALMQVSRRLE